MASTPVYEYRIEVYSGGKWVTLGQVRRPGALLAAWTGAGLGRWPAHVTRVPIRPRPSDVKL